MSYYVNRDGRQYGPYSPTQLVQMAREGRFGPTDLIWLDDQKVWKPASEVIGHIVPATNEPAAESAVPPADVSAQAQAASEPPPPETGTSARPSLTLGGYAPPSAVASTSGGPVPPGMHWALVLLLAVLTCGIFAIIWIFVEAVFVRKIDPKSNAILMLVLYIVGIFVGEGIAVTGTLRGRDGEVLALVGSLIVLGCVVLFFAAMFGMRSSLESYYNSAENIRLKLSGIMTFFFAVYYFQYHFKRIADWKQTGRLQPQY